MEKYIEYYISNGKIFDVIVKREAAFPRENPVKLQQVYAFRTFYSDAPTEELNRGVKEDYVAFEGKIINPSPVTFVGPTMSIDDLIAYESHRDIEYPSRNHNWKEQGADTILVRDLFDPIPFDSKKDTSIPDIETYLHTCRLISFKQ